MANCSVENFPQSVLLHCLAPLPKVRGRISTCFLQIALAIGVLTSSLGVGDGPVEDIKSTRFHAIWGLCWYICLNQVYSMPIKFKETGPTFN